MSFVTEMHINGPFETPHKLAAIPTNLAARSRYSHPSIGGILPPQDLQLLVDVRTLLTVT